MGSKGLVGFRLNNTYRATYNHWDSYISELGFEVVNFIQAHLQDQESIAQLKIAVSKLTWVDISSPVPGPLQVRYERFANLAVGPKPSLAKWYNLLREAQGAACLEPVLTRELVHLINYTSFIQDSLMCDYAYFLNLDTDTLEIWAGRQKVPRLDNPFGTKNDRGYYPCALSYSVPFADANPEWIKSITAKKHKEDEERQASDEPKENLEIAGLILAHYSGDAWQTWAAWKRLMQNGITLKSFKSSILEEIKTVSLQPKEVRHRLAIMIFDRWDKKSHLATAAWNRLMEEAMTVNDFEEYVET